MTTDRPYRHAVPPDAALAEIDRLRVAQFMLDAAPLPGDALSWWSAAPPGAIASRVMTRVTHREIHVNGLRMHVAECGEGPLVLLLHGFPESWYSWRHQLAALADARFHAVAPDQRGYGGTTRPEAIERYTLLLLVGDVIGLIDALGE